ncbi:MAG: LacI family transcriptional regulator [Lachnospiraceae bacterium]|nr:LacI family transcriptional regulator [Lachnospiraceae bacterium]
MVTLKDIATACGISRATVSKVINGYDDVSQETIQIVRAKAEEMGYLPNLAARSLKTNRTYNLGILFSDELGSGLKHEYFTGILNSFKNDAEECGYSITFISDQPGGRKMTFLEQCHYRNFDGVLIACADYGDERVRELVTSDLPTVTTDYVFEECSAVISDNSGGMRTLMEYICGLGHQRIAYIHGEMTAVTRNRLASFYKCCDDFGISSDDCIVEPSRYRDPASAAELTERMMNSRKRPTCILYPDDCALVGGMNCLERLGFGIPDDISIAGYDGSYLSEILRPRLTTVHQNTEEIGKTAARLLIDAVENRRTWIPEHVTVPGRLVPGETVKRIDG